MEGKCGKSKKEEITERDRSNGMLPVPGADSVW